MTRTTVPHHLRGMTLIELMVALTIGLFLTWGAFEVYVQSKNNYRAAEVLTRLQENARFALESVEPDLRLAGYWGSELVNAGSGVAITCDAVDVTPMVLRPAEPIAAADGAYDLDCAPFSEARAGSDVLIVRHATADVKTPDAGKVQLQADLDLAEIFSGGVPPPDFGPTSQTRDVVFHAYYVDNASSFAGSVPSLRRLTLVGGGIENQEMISGVENLQVQFGLDTNGDGVVERYVDPDSAAVTEGVAGFLPDARIVAVRLWLLVRSEESPSPAFRDEHEYLPLDADEAPIVPGSALYPAQFQRLEVTKTIFLRNEAVRG